MAIGIRGRGQRSRASNEVTKYRDTPDNEPFDSEQPLCWQALERDLTKNGRLIPQLANVALEDPMIRILLTLEMIESSQEFSKKHKI
jgi:hypothetical protein